MLLIRRVTISEGIGGGNKWPKDAPKQVVIHNYFGTKAFACNISFEVGYFLLHLTRVRVFVV